MATQTPQELQPAYERQIDRESIDARMGEQISFERNLRRSHPRDFSDHESDGSNLKDKIRRGATTTAVVGAAVVSAAALGKLTPSENTPLPKATVITVHNQHGLGSKEIISSSDASPAQLAEQRYIEDNK